MQFALFLLLPFLASGVARATKERRLVSGAIALSTLVIEANLLRFLGPEDHLVVGDVSLGVTRYEQIFLLLFLIVGSLTIAYSHWLQPSAVFPSQAMLIIGCANATVMVEDPYLAVFLLQLTGLATLTVVYRPLADTNSLPTFQKYLILIVLSGFFLTLAFSLIEPFLLYRDNFLLAKLIVAMLAIGFGLRLAAIPFHLWFPDLSEHAPPMATVLIVAVVNSTGLLLLLTLIEKQPWLFDVTNGSRLLLMAAIIAILGGAVLALGEGELSRVFAYGAVHSLGFVFLGLASLQFSGLVAAVFETLTQALSLLLIFMSLGMIGHCVGHTKLALLGGLRARLPISTIGLATGVLSLLGVPPFASFASRWMLFLIAARQSTGLVIALAVGSAVAAVALLRAFLKTFFGEGKGGKLTEERWPAAVAILLLSALLLLIGLVPAPLFDAVRSAVTGFVAYSAP